jgi:broad specificity phosphatase PhoE
MSRLRFLLLSFVVLLPVLALSRVAQANWLDDLRLGGYVIVLRHGTTNSDVANKDPMSNPNARTSVERQLNAQGREQAEAIGRAMRALWIPVSSVMTSPLQRAVDTGTLLGFGKVGTNPDLAEAGAAVTPDESARRADALRKLVSFHLADDGNLVIVTHKPNLVEAFGKDLSDVREGEASVFEPDFAGFGYRLVARIQADRNLLQVQQDVDDVFLHALDARVLVQHALDLGLGDRTAGHR